VSLLCVAVDLPTDMEMSKVVADLEYVLADSCGLADDADMNADDHVAGSSSDVNKVCDTYYYVLCYCN